MTKEYSQLIQTYEALRQSNERKRIYIEKLEAQLKAKDDEIKELKLELLKSFPKIANTKARKIVAMLFWEWRRLETEGITEEAFAAKVCFYKAHALLKE